MGGWLTSSHDCLPHPVFSLDIWVDSYRQGVGGWVGGRGVDSYRQRVSGWDGWVGGWVGGLPRAMTVFPTPCSPLMITPWMSGLMAVRRSAVLMFSCPSTRPRGNSLRMPVGWVGGWVGG